jgi:hypothetical protein
MLTESWVKSGRSAMNGECVEVRLVNDAVEIRDSKDVAGPTLRVPPSAWLAFINEALDRCRQSF